MFLDATSVSLADLQQRIAQQPPTTEQPWEFNDLGRRPIVRLPDGSVQGRLRAGAGVRPGARVRRR
jgi:hypothetical protein